MFMNIFKKKYTITVTALWVTIILITGSLAVNTGCKKGPEPKDFNVVLIVIDTLRSDHLPFYGYEKDTAPFMGKLAQQGVVFENAFSASSWTSPGTASILTGLYPYQHGVLMGLLAIRNAQKINPDLEVNRIPEEIVTMAEMFKTQGYRTYGVADNLNIGERQGFTQGFDKFRTFMYKQAPAVNGTLKKWHKNLTEKGKYFLYIHYMEPHAPYHQREPWYKPFEDKKLNRISAYDSEINYVDQHIKEMFELFKWEKDTLIIITADHGEGLWDHGIMGHGKTLYREEIQVPLVFYIPGHIKPRRVPFNVSTVDIMPTVREFCGFSPFPGDVGQSLAPVMEDRPHQLDKRDIFSYLWVKMEKEIEWRSTIYKKWHFIFKLPNFRYLFSLLKDQKEKNNLMVQGKATADELEKRFDGFRAKSKKFEQKSAKVKLDKKKTDKLKSLGYVH